MKELKMYKVELKIKGKDTPSCFGTMATSRRRARRKAKDFYSLAKNTKVGKAMLSDKLRKKYAKA